MSVRLFYGHEPVVLPLAALSHIDGAPKGAVTVLMTLAAERTLGEVIEHFGREEWQTRFGLTLEEGKGALAYWQGVGVLEPSEGVATQPVPKPTPKPVARVKVSEVPQYTSEELTGILEGHREIAQLIDECQRVLGRTFNMHDIGIVVGLADYFGFDSEYILILCSHCAKIGKTTMRYLERLAAGLYDDGIHDAGTLYAHLEKREQLQSFEGVVRSMFGFSTRRLSTKEKKFIATWMEEFGYGEEIVALAYELTIDAIHEPSMA